MHILYLYISAFLSTWSFSFCSVEVNDLPELSTLCVLPDSPGEEFPLYSSIPENCNSSYYLNNLSSSDIIKSSTQVVFLQGTFFLQSVWSFRNVQDITLMKDHSASRVVIDCRSSDSWILFENSTNVRIEGLEIDNCGARFSTFCSLTFLNGQLVTIVDAKIVRGTNALCVSNVNDSLNIIRLDVDRAVASNDSGASNGGISVNYTENQEYRTKVYFKELFISNSGALFERDYCGTSNASTGGVALTIKSAFVTVEIRDSYFERNTGCNGGSVLILLDNFNKNNTLVVIHNTTFLQNHAIIGGAIYLSFEWTFSGSPVIPNKSTSTAVVIHNCTFKENNAHLDGGGVYIQWKESHYYKHTIPQNVYISGCSFNNNSISPYGSGGLGIHFKTYVTFQDQRYEYGKTRVNLIVSDSEFTNHVPSLDYTQKQRLESSVILAKSAPYINLQSVTISNNDCTAVLAISSIIIFSGDSEISDNTAMTGAGLRLCSDSFLYFLVNTSLLITRNTAHVVGGGIFVDSKCLVNKPKCFYQFEREVTLNYTLLDTINVTVRDNNANQTGSNLYGGSIDYCYLYNIRSTETNFKFPLHIPNNTQENNISISSEPQQVCFVESDKFGCNKAHNISIYPGQKVKLRLIIIGQMNGFVSGSVSVTHDQSTALFNNQVTQHISKFVEEVNYTIMSGLQKLDYNKDNFKMFLNVDTASSSNSELSRKFSPANLTVRFKKCPIGFILLKKNGNGYHCNCSSNHFTYVIRCSLDQNASAFLIKHKESWIGWDEHLYYSAKYCPLDYCTLVHEIEISNGALQQNSQCAFNREGILCGACKHNLSLVFGNNRCKKCSNIYLLLLIPFTIAGPILVLLISYFDITITSGTLNGIIFYFNIIQINSIDLLSKNKIPVLSKILLVFTAWLNLDLGIEVCFYDGMTAFTRTLLQTAFPMYLLAITLTIVVFSRKSTRVTRLVGENAVKVLATLILFSYTKIILVTFGSLNTTQLRVYNETANVSHYYYRWVLDGTIPYFNSYEHMILVVVSVFLILVSFPFTLSLLCIKYTYTLSHCSKIFSIFNKLKPFYDAFTGPFKGGSRFWPGLLLVIRFAILMSRIVKIGSFNISDYMALVACLSLLSTMIFKNGVYKKRANNILEGFFLVNLAFIFINAIAFSSDNKFRKICNNASVSISLLLLFGILCIQIHKKISSMKCSQKITRRSQTVGSFDTANETVARYEVAHERGEDEDLLNSGMVNFSRNK